MLTNKYDVAKKSEQKAETKNNLGNYMFYEHML